MFTQFDRLLLRRSFLKSALTLQAEFELCRPAASHSTSQAGSESLRGAAEHHHCLFGSAVKMSVLASDQKYADLIARQCGIITPEGSLKWDMLRPSPDTFDFSDSDKLFAFARKNRQLVRGHTLVWHQGLPRWFTSYVSPQNAQSLLENHIRTVVGKYAGQVHSWDVVNEVIDAKQGNGLQDTAWSKYIGPDYIEQAFRMAHSIDSRALLIYNEVRLEPDKSDAAPRQAAVVKLLASLKKKKVPIDGLGIQSHIWDREPSSEDWARFGSFLNEVRSMGVSILVTELDLRAAESKYPAVNVQALLANRCSKYLSFVLKEGGVKTVLSWGLSSKYSWLRNTGSHQAIGLPYDDSLKKTPTWDAIAHLFSAT